MNTERLLAACDEVLAAIKVEDTEQGRTYTRVPEAILGLSAQYELARHVRELYDPTPIDEAALKNAGLQNPSGGSYWMLPAEAKPDWDVVKWAGGWNVRAHFGINCKTVGHLRHLLDVLKIGAAE